MSLHVVASIDELPPGSRKIVEVAGREIGIFNLGGNFYAVRNRCPHMGGPVCSGTVGGAVSADIPGEYQFDGEREIIRCPWHQWEFDVRTGQSWFDPARIRVRAYEARVESGTALAHTDAVARSPAQAAGEPPPDPSGMVPGPYVVDTYPVSIDQDYVVVELD